MTESPDPETRAERIASSVKEQFDEIDSSRRSFLGRSALVGGTLLALGSASGSVLAQEGGDEAGTAATADEEAFDDVEGTDLDVLNYALSLEHLESALYSEALDQFDEDDFADSGVLSGIGEGLGSEVYAFIETIAEQEEVHIEVLTEAVQILGGTPAEADSYDFGLDTVEDFLAVAQEVENLAVAGLAGAAPYVESPDLLSTLLSIHSVEARHATLLNALSGNFPFPNAFDSPSSQQEVLDAIDSYVASDDGEAAEEEEEETETPEEEEETETATETETETATETETETTTEAETTAEPDESPFGEGNETTGSNATADSNATSGSNATTESNETTVFGNGSE